MELGKKPLTKSDARDAPRCPPRGCYRFRFRPNAVEKWRVPKSKERYPAIRMLSHFSIGTGAPNARYNWNQED